MTIVVAEIPEVETQISSFYKSKKEHGSKQVKIGKGGQGPSDDRPILLKLSNPVSKLTDGPRMVSCAGFGMWDCQPISFTVISSLACDPLKFGPLLVLPNSNQNLPQSTL